MPWSLRLSPPARSRQDRVRLRAAASRALKGWALLTLALGAARAPRFWPELSSLLGRPPMCANEPNFEVFADALPRLAPVILVTDRSPELSVESMFCAQYALAPRPVERRFAVHFDPTAAPATALLVDVHEAARRAKLLAARESAARAVGLTLDASRRSGEILLVTAEAPTR